MKLRRLDADVQHFGDLFGGSPLSYKWHPLPFARRERRAAAPVTALGSRAGIHDRLGSARAHVQPAFANLLDRLDEIVAALAFLHEAPHADLQRLRDEARVVHTRE